MGIKIYNRDIIIETVILFSLFYLPSYLFQGAIGDPAAFNDPIFNFQLWIVYLPQISLILYIIHTNHRKSFADFGICNLTTGEIPSIALTAVGLIFLVAIIQGLLFLLPSTTDMENLFIWDFSNRRVIPLIFITSLLTGYSEELFFRSYLYTRFEELGLGKIHIIFTISLIFALGHFYEGYEGGINAFVLGSYFSFVFLWKRNIHIPAIVHGLYNFSALMISFYMQ
jgi:CAAX protease family protein